MMARRELAHAWPICKLPKGELAPVSVVNPPPLCLADAERVGAKSVWDLYAEDDWWEGVDREYALISAQKRQLLLKLEQIQLNPKWTDEEKQRVREVKSPHVFNPIMAAALRAAGLIHQPSPTPSSPR
jgi:hypothetical protein